MKTKKAFLSILLILLCALYIYPDSASASIQVTIILPKRSAENIISVSGPDVSSSIPSSIYPAGPDIEVLGFSAGDTATLRIKNCGSVKKIITVSLSVLGTSGKKTLCSYDEITVNPGKSLKIRMAGESVRSAAGEILIAEVIEDGIVVASAGTNAEERRENEKEII